MHSKHAKIALTTLVQLLSPTHYSCNYPHLKAFIYTNPFYYMLNLEKCSEYIWINYTSLYKNI